MENQNYIKLFITTNPMIHGHDVIELTNHNGDTFTSKSEQFIDFISRSEICEHKWVRTTRNKKLVKICCKCRVLQDNVKTHETAHAATINYSNKIDEIISILKSAQIKQETYSNAEACKFLKASRRSLQLWRTYGILPHAIINTHLIYTHDNLMEFIENHTRHSKRNVPNQDEIAIAAERYAGNEVGEQRSFFAGANWIISKLGY